MGFDDPIVVEPKAFTERVLGDLEAAINVAPQGRGEEESDGEGEWPRLQSIHQRGTGGGLGQRHPDLLPHVCFVGTSDGGQEPAAIYRGILMVDAGRDRQRKREPLSGHRWERQWVLGNEPSSGGLDLRQDGGTIKRP